VQGGDTLEVSFQESDGQYREVKLTGPADFAFEGKISLAN
jgi:diaminopimelate epimerase